MLFGLILFLIFPLIAGTSGEIVKSLFSNDIELNLKMISLNIRISLLYFTWSFLLFVLIPYSFIYLKTTISSKSLIIKLLLFFILLVIGGVFAPELTVVEILNVDIYPRAFILYLLLTITLCPLCNMALNIIVKDRQRKSYKGILDS